MIHIINRQRHMAIRTQSIKKIAQETLKKLGHEDKDINLVFVGNRSMQHLNREFRKIDKSTDVLSFQYLQIPSPYLYKDSTITDITNEDNFLGEVIISTQTANKYAQELKLTFPVEIKILIIHGILHLCGYDHEVDNGEMIKLERHIRKNLINNTDW